MSTTLTDTEQAQLEERYLTISSQIQQIAETAQRKTLVNLLAVSKYHSIEKIRSLYQLGQKSFGENYVSEAVEKIEHLKKLPIEWHFIGPIQSNKTKLISQHFAWVHSVDRIKIAQRLNNHLKTSNKKMNICLQININEEEQKSGFLPDQLDPIMEQLQDFEHLLCRGLMAIPENTSDPLRQQKNFQALRVKMNELNTRYQLSMDTLSMGMSGDLEAAIKEGATIVRIGTAIFGPRN